MKKTFSIAIMAIMALLGIQDIKAQTAIFSLETIADGNATVGSFEKSGVNNSDSDTKRWTMKSSGAYIKCTTSQAIQEGDELIIAGETRSTSTNGFYVRMEGTKDAEAVAELKGSGKKKAQTTRYTVEAGSKLIGQSTFYVMMANKERQWWIDSIVMNTQGVSTGISSVSANKTDKKVYYDLNGRQVKTPQKGHIYVSNNGKKVVY